MFQRWHGSDAWVVWFLACVVSEAAWLRHMSGIILGLCCFRGGMVQTHEQYDFVHQALVEYERTLGEPSIQSLTALSSDGHWQRPSALPWRPHSYNTAAICVVPRCLSAAWDWPGWMETLRSASCVDSLQNFLASSAARWLPALSRIKWAAWWTIWSDSLVKRNLKRCEKVCHKNIQV